MTTPLSRMAFTHPAQGAPGDASLYSAIETIYQNIGDSMPARWSAVPSVANGATQTFTHGLKLAFSELKIAVYTYDVSNNLTRIRTGYTVVANGTNPTTAVDVTNTTGSTANIAVLILQTRGAEALADLSDVNPAGAQDGQALVYNASSAQFLPGASGDASFKIQGVASSVATIKGGFLILADGRELATYNGSTYGSDFTAALTTLLATPANGQTYYLYIDNDSLSASVLEPTTNRKVYAVTQSNLTLSITTPDLINRARYTVIGLVQGAAANTYSATVFRTTGVRRHNNNPQAVNPVTFNQVKQLVGTVGSSGQLIAGHILSSKSFASSVAAGSRSWYNLSADATDGSGNGNNLTNNGSVPFTGTNILGSANSSAVLNGSSQYLSSTAGLFNPGPGKSFAVGGWFKAASWTPASDQCLFSNQASNTDRGFGAQIKTSGAIEFFGTNTASATDTDLLTAATGYSAGSWHHVALVYDFTNSLLKGYLDGVLKISGALANQRSLTSTGFLVGGINSATPVVNFFNGSVEEVFFLNNVSPTTEDIRKLYSYRLDHNKDTSATYQEWDANIYTDGSGDVHQDGSSWLVSKGDRNSLFLDFSALNAVDSIELTMKDTGFTAYTLPVTRFDQTFTVNPSFPLTNTVGAPFAPRILQEITPGVWEEVSSQGLLSVSSTQISGDLSTLFTNGATQVRILGGLADASAAVADANATRSGIVNVAAQTFAGTKRLQDGLQVGSAGSTLLEYVDWTDFTPSIGGASLTTSSVARYMIMGKTMFVAYQITVAVGGAPVQSITVTIPASRTSGLGASGSKATMMPLQIDSQTALGHAQLVNAATVIDMRRDGASSNWAASTTYVIRGSGFFQIA